MDKQDIFLQETKADMGNSCNKFFNRAMDGCPKRCCQTLVEALHISVECSMREHSIWLMCV